jgi:hypothetical protein
MKPYYEHGGVTIYHADCRELIPSLRCDVVLTDPPYGIDWHQHGGGKTGKSKGMRRLPRITGDTDTTVRDEALLMLAPKPALVFGSFRAKWPPNLVQVLVYQKTPDAGLVGSTTGFRRDAEPIFLLGEWPKRNAKYSSVFASRIGLQSLAKPGYHPHAKPLDVLCALLRGMPAGIVLDPFMGSGSVLVAAKNLGREAIGVETEEQHCETAAKRLQQEVLDFGGAA